MFIVFRLYIQSTLNIYSKHYRYKTTKAHKTLFMQMEKVLYAYFRQFYPLLGMNFSPKLC